MSVRRVSPREAQSLVQDGGYAYLDVRAVPEFDTGHPPGAFNVPLRTPRTGGGMDENEQFVAEVRAALPEARRIVVGCAAGVRSLCACELLLAAGFDDVIDQRAGLEAVRDAFCAVAFLTHAPEGIAHAGGRARS